MRKFVNILILVIALVGSVSAQSKVDPSKLSKLSQLKNIDVQQIESSEDPKAELQRQLIREYTQLSNKVDFMKDDGKTYRKYLHFAPAVPGFIYCYVVGYKDGTFHLVMEYKDEEIFFQSQILNTEVWFNENGDPLYSDAPGVAIKIHTKLGTIVILDDVDSSYDYFVIWPKD